MYKISKNRARDTLFAVNKEKGVKPGALSRLAETVDNLRKEADEHSRKAAAGYDEGWYNGEENAYEKVLELIKEVLK